MSTTIDNKVVEMRFDNRNFEQNASTTMSTLDKLKEKLSFKGASKGLDDVNTAARNVNMSPLASAVETVHARFSALQIMGVTALTNITNSAVNAGKRMVAALTIDPIKTGFQEYETQMGAIQTILANTQHEGTNLKDVNAALDELNTYADQTIYNFTEMTRNIGTFTAAGVKLDTSVSSIKGIANLAAISGSTSQQASTAMYQLSQALAAGRVSLMDWNSVVNAGMGGKVFQDALIRTATHMGTNVDELIKKYGSFRESLTQGEWLTAEVLTETLTQLSGAYTEADLIAQGYTEEQARQITELAKTAVGAATEVKTFTQLWDTLKEAAQSGWSQTWRLLVGDFEEAKSLLTGISNTIGGMINKASESRNELLKGWKDLGGRQDVIDGLANAFDGLMSIIKPIGEAFKNVFPELTAKKLYNFTAGFKKLTEGFKLSDSTADKLRRTFEGLFSVVDFFRKILTAVAKGIGSLFNTGGISGILDLILSFTAVIGDVFTSINNGFSGKGLSNLLSTIGEVISGALHGLTGFGDAVSGVGKAVSDVIGTIVDVFKAGFGWIRENVSFGDVLAGLAGGGIFMAGKKLAGLFESLQGLTDKGFLGLLFGGGDGGEGNEGIVSKFKSTLDGVNESLGAFTNGIKIGSLLAIAGSIAILSAALGKIAELKVGDIMKSLTAIGIMFKMLTTSFTSINKSLSVFAGTGVIKTGIAMMMMAQSIKILAGAMVEMSGLKFGQIVKGLIGIGGGMAALTIGMNALNGVKIKITTIIAITTLATALKSIGETLAGLGQMTWKEIRRGLTAMGGALAELVVTLKILETAGGVKSLVGSVGILIVAKSLDEIASAISKIGGLSWGEIARGLAGMGAALTEIAVITGLLGTFAGATGLLGAITLYIVAESLGPIASALSDIGLLSWGEIARGLVGMGGALTELAVITGLLGTFAGATGLLGAITLVIAVQALDEVAKAFGEFACMSWDTIKMGLVGMGGALAEVALITGILGKLTGLKGLVGSVSILIAVQSLGKLADGLKKFGSMTWGEIKRGLVGMGLALAEIVIISGVLGKLGGLKALVGSASILLAVQGLGDIADALKKFGFMSWDEITHGITAMGLALGTIALGGIANTLSIIGSLSLSKVAEPLGVLADSIKKWTGVTIPPNLGIQLGLLATGISAFTWGGLGALAIAEVAAPLGVMADSVKKWTNVVVPENLGTNLKALADGVKTFTWGGMGASAISEVAGPLGTMANSVAKWSNVTVPENLGTKLETLADGVKSFSWAFMGGWSISSVAEPLGKLASSVKKWNNIEIPAGLKDKLTNLSDGIKAFSWAFMGGWSLSAVTEPLGELATSVKKWNGVSVPENLNTQLKELANALKSFAGMSNVKNGVEAVTSISNAIKKLSGVNISTISTGLNGFSDSLSKLGSSSGSLAGVGTKIVSNIVTPLENLGPKLKTVGKNAVSQLANGIKNSSAVKTAASNIASTISKTIGDKTDTLKTAGSKMGTAFSKGITSKKSAAKTAATELATTAGKAAKNDTAYNSFYNAGKHVAKGFAQGISANTYLAEAKAKAMANAAATAAKKALQIHSPSRVFIKIASYIPQGFAIGLTKFGTQIKDSAESMAGTALGTVRESISRIGSVIETGIDAVPTIRPVLDLSDVKSGANSIGSMFSNATVGVAANVGAINSMMNANNQNGGNSDVVSAINKLRKDLGNVGSTTYNVNGITYDDGSNITDAVKTIARAALMERRV